MPKKERAAAAARKRSGTRAGAQGSASAVAGRRATIRDVAERAKVSTATVSFVLNDNPHERISEVVRQRVLGAARALSYHPSAAAAGLARKRNHNVGLVFFEGDNIMTNHFYSFVVQGAVKEAVERKYNLLFSYVDAAYKGFDQLPKMVREKNVEGVIFMQRVNPAMIRDISALNIPVVLVDSTPRIGGINALQIDNSRGGALAAEHLLGLGHRQLAMLLPRDPPPSVEQRFQSFQHAVEAAGQRFTRKENVVEARGLSFSAAREATAEFLGKRPPVTALFCANDEMAAGVIRAAHQAGYEVPRELSVVGFDDIVMSNYTDPPLTTVGVVKEHLGRRAMARLIELVEGVDDRVKIELAPVTLMVRGSTARAPGLAR